MSDFLFSTTRRSEGTLSALIQGIYHRQTPEVQEFHGKWGSLAVSRSMYNGFDTHETESHICAVIGGPVLYFRDNSFLKDAESTEGARAIYERWITKEAIQWDNDLSGPFAIFLLIKKTADLKIVTDLLSFIPIFKNRSEDNTVIGTHVDTVAKASKNQNDLDYVSISDFILNGIVTYPYTFYKKLRQLKPGTIHSFSASSEHDEQTYWLPDQEVGYNSIKEAATAIRDALKEYIARVTVSMTKVGCFISGGEDSRTILAALPDRCEKQAFIFLDQMNREGRIAQKTAETYNAEFNLQTRSSTYYLDILPGASDLVGSGFEYKHSHAYQLASFCDFKSFSAVFGGLLSDALLKGNQISKKRRVRLPFVPLKIVENKNNKDIEFSFTKNRMLSKINSRRENHLKTIKEIRPASKDEWFYLWPISMDKDIAYVHCNRRIFRSYEPFMSNKIVRISSAISQNYKVNRKVFQKAVQPLLRKSRFLTHSGSGTFPYYPWYINEMSRIGKKIKRTLFENTYEGPWTDWEKLLKSDKTIQLTQKYSQGFENINDLFNQSDLLKLMEKSELNVTQKINLLQVSFFLKEMNE